MDDDGAWPRSGQAEGLEPDDAARAAEIQAFWEGARVRAGLVRTAVVTGLSVAATMPPPAWAFGGEPALADALLGLVLAGTKTATSTALAELEQAGEPAPRKGDLSIVLDGAGHPRALLRTTRVEIVTFRDVDADHAHAEGEGPLASWRREHERYFHRVLEGTGTEFSDDLPLVLERFEVLYPHPSEQ